MPKRDQAGAREPSARDELQQATSAQQSRQVIVKATIVVLQVLFTVVDPHH